MDVADGRPPGTLPVMKSKKMIDRLGRVGYNLIRKRRGCMSKGILAIINRARGVSIFWQGRR